MESPTGYGPRRVVEEDGRGYLLIEMKITTNFGK